MDLLFIGGFMSHLEIGVAPPLTERLWERMGSFARVIAFDKRGMGLSDMGTYTLENTVGDALAVLDTGANPAEYLLHALAACMTTSIVCVAAARKVQLTSVESTLTGEMDVRGALGVDDEPRNGFERIGVAFRVTGTAPAEKLREVVGRARKRSAVYDMVTNGVPVAVEVTTH
ncbi:MAG TPA: OsmC family protein [Solirubrobacteraceae bacterium]|nr:OsmC family protein [Solirubrobacteraceae bacterium]